MPNVKCRIEESDRYSEQNSLQETESLSFPVYPSQLSFPHLPPNQKQQNPVAEYSCAVGKKREEWEWNFGKTRHQRQRVANKGEPRQQQRWPAVAFHPLQCALRPFSLQASRHYLLPSPPPQRVVDGNADAVPHRCPNQCFGRVHSCANRSKQCGFRTKRNQRCCQRAHQHQRNPTNVNHGNYPRPFWLYSGECGLRTSIEDSPKLTLVVIARGAIET